MSVCDTPGHTQIKSAQKWNTDIDTHIQTNIRRICLFIVILGVLGDGPTTIITPTTLILINPISQIT